MVNLNCALIHIKQRPLGKVLKPGNFLFEYTLLTSMKRTFHLLLMLVLFAFSGKEIYAFG